MSLAVAGAGTSVSLHKSRERRERTVFPETLAAALAALADEVHKDAPAGGVLLLVDEVWPARRI